MKKKATIYPYSKEDVHFFRYASFLNEIDPIFAVSPPGWGLCGQDVTEIDGGKATGFKITENLSDALKYSEILIISSFEKYYGEEGGLVDTLKTAIQHKIPFRFYYSPKVDEKEVFFSMLQEAKELGLVSHFKEQEKFEQIPGMDYCQKLNSPITLIVGQGPSSGKFETQLGLRNELIKRGYKISQIGSKPYCELFDFHSFPSFMLNNDLNETEKIISFNHFIKGIEDREKPELIIVGIPGGIMPIVDKVHNNFGMLHVEVASALEPDAIIYNLYANSYSTKFYDKSADLIYNRFNHTLPACFIVTNLWIDYGALMEKEIFNVLTFNKMYDKIIEKPSKNIPVISIKDVDTFIKVADATISILEEYGSVNYY